MSNACCLKLAACCFFRMFLRIILKCLKLVAATSESAVATLGACKAPPIPSVAPCGARTTKGGPALSVPYDEQEGLFLTEPNRIDQLPTLEHLSN